LTLGEAAPFNPYYKEALSMGTLKTLAWSNQNGVRRPRITVIDLDNVEFFQEHDAGNGTCLIALKTDDVSGNYRAMHVDISVNQMIAIMKEHKNNPDKDFDTHPSFTDEDIVEEKKSRKTSKQ
jgi:hypothetical protein